MKNTCVANTGLGIIGSILDKRNPPIQTAAELKAALASMHNFDTQKHNVAHLERVTNLSPEQLAAFVKQKYALTVRTRSRSDTVVRRSITPDPWGSNWFYDYHREAVAPVASSFPKTELSRSELINFVNNLPGHSRHNRELQKLKAACGTATRKQLQRLADRLGVRLEPRTELLPLITTAVVDYLRPFLLGTKTNVNTTIEIRDIAQELVSLHKNPLVRRALQAYHNSPRYSTRRLGGMMGLHQRIHESKPPQRIGVIKKRPTPPRPPKKLSVKPHATEAKATKLGQWFEGYLQPKQRKGAKPNTRLERYLKLVRTARDLEARLIKRGDIKIGAPDHAVPPFLAAAMRAKRKREKEMRSRTVRKRRQEEFARGKTSG